MSKFNSRELAGGIFITVTGAVFALYAMTHYAIGTITRMGPGMVPLALGVLLALFGICLMVGAAWKPVRRGEIRIFVPAVILISIVAFAALINPFGLLPAVFVSAVIATLAEVNVRPVVTLALALALCLTAWLIFVVALQLPLTLFKWPL